jgi:SAM-dependent methyltransferase
VPQRWRTSQFLLGIEGLALLRRWVTGDANDVEARVREIEHLCARYRDPPPGDVIEVDDVDAMVGYSALAETYDDAQNALLLAEEPPLRELLERLKKGRVLDAACGTGRHTAFLVERGHDVTGLDATPAMLDLAKERVPEARFVRGDLRRMPFASDSFDAVLCALALTHLPTLQPALGELARVVRPGGDVVLSDIHPIAAATGAHVTVHRGEGKVALVRNHFHPHSRYLDGFERTGLRVETCLEPPWETERYGAAVTEDMRAALDMAVGGLPFVLIWHLRAS